MKKWKIGFMATGSLLVILALTLSAGAQQGKQIQPGNRDDVAQSLGVRDFIRGLQLTETQRQEIRAILQSHKTEILENREALLGARLALIKEDPNGPGLFGAAQTKLTEMRLQIFGQIKAKLTPDQLAALQERQQRRADRLERMLERLQNRGKN